MIDQPKNIKDKTLKRSSNKQKIKCVCIVISKPKVDRG